MGFEDTTMASVVPKNIRPVADNESKSSTLTGLRSATSEPSSASRSIPAPLMWLTSR